jgi:hypothetical protein
MPALDSGFAHELSGWFIFVLCLAMLLLTRQLFNKMYVLNRS